MPPKRAPRAPRQRRTNTITAVTSYIQNAQRFFAPNQLPNELRVSQYAIRRRPAVRNAVDEYRQAMNATIQTASEVRDNGDVRFDTVSTRDLIALQAIEENPRAFEEGLNQEWFALINRALATAPALTTNERGAYTRRMQLNFELRMMDMDDGEISTRNWQLAYFDATADFTTLQTFTAEAIASIFGKISEYGEVPVELTLTFRTADFPPNLLGMNANGCLEALRRGNEQWYCPDTPATLNCLWNAYTMATRETVEEVETYIDKKGKLKKAWEKACLRKKNKYIAKLSDKERQTSGEESLQALANGESRSIDIYDHLFNLKTTFHPSKPVNNPKPNVSLMLDRNHFIAMLPKALQPEALSAHTNVFGNTRKTPGFFDSARKPAVSMEQTVANLRQQMIDEAKAEKKRQPYSKMFEMPRRFVPHTFGTFDFETCTDRVLYDGETSKWYEYACGVYTPENGYQKFWGLDCATQLLDYLWGIREEFGTQGDDFENKCTFAMYAHNSASFDANLVLRALLTKPPELATWRISPDQIISNGKYIRFTIYDPNRPSICINFQDSIAYLISGLGTLGKEFNCEVQKGSFDHEKVNITNFYDFQEECDIYLKADVMSLYEILVKHEKNVWDSSYSTKTIAMCKHANRWGLCKLCKKNPDNQRPIMVEKGGIMMTQCITAANIAKKTLFHKYYDVRHMPIYTPTVDEFNYIKRAYQGGRNETFVPTGHPIYGKIFYKDFTSMYPYVASVNKLPCDEMKFVELHGVKATLENLPYGFVRCMVRSLDFQRKALHCYKENGKCLFPYFKDPVEMTIYSEEIKVGLVNNLYEYHMLDVITYAQKRYVLKAFMTDGFEQKSKQAELGNTGRALAEKININSGYGVFGMSTFNKESGRIEHKDVSKLDTAFAENRVLDVNRHGDYIVSREIRDIPSKDVNIGIAAAITSLARILLWRLMDSIEQEGGEIYYCDTDSIITNFDTDKNERIRAIFNPSGTGKKLGELKCEITDKLIKGKYCEKQDIETVGNWMDGLCVGALKAYGMSKNHPLMYKPMDIATQKGGNKDCVSSEYFHAGCIPIQVAKNTTIDVLGTRITKDVFHRGGISALLRDTDDVCQMRFQKAKPKNIRFQYEKAKVSAERLLLSPLVWTKDAGFQ